MCKLVSVLPTLGMSVHGRTQYTVQSCIGQHTGTAVEYGSRRTAK